MRTRPPPTGPLSRGSRAATSATPKQRRDLLQDIHLALWQSLDTFDGRCSLRTWTYRVAHNIAISKIVRRRGTKPTLVGLDELDLRSETADRER